MKKTFKLHYSWGNPTCPLCGESTYLELFCTSCGYSEYDEEEDDY